MMTPMTDRSRSARAVDTLLQVDPQFQALVQTLYGPHVDAEEVWTDVFTKRGPDQADLNTGDEKRKRVEHRIAQASNALGLTAGTAALATAARDPRLADTKIGRAGKLIPVPKKLQAGLNRLGPKKVAGAALGLQAANVAGDVITARVLGEGKKKKPEPLAKGLVPKKLKLRMADNTPEIQAERRAMRDREAEQKAQNRVERDRQKTRMTRPLWERPAEGEPSFMDDTRAKRDRYIAEMERKAEIKQKAKAQRKADYYGEDVGKSTPPLTLTSAKVPDPEKAAATHARWKKTGKFLRTGKGKALVGVTAAGGYVGNRKIKAQRELAAQYEEFYGGKRDTAEITFAGEFSKVDTDERLAFGWASVTQVDGLPVIDRQADYMTTDDIEKAAYEYVLKSRVGGDMHKRNGEAAHKVSDLVESFVVTDEKIQKMGLPEDTPRGWWVGFKIHDDEAWSLVKKGERTGFSIHGRGRREEIGIDKVMGYR